MANQEVVPVRKTKSDNLVWASREDRLREIRRELVRQGYTVKITDDALAKKFYISRSATVVSGQIEKAFSTAPQLQKFMREWNRYDRMYDTIQVVHRDVIEQQAANRILGTQVYA